MTPDAHPAPRHWTPVVVRGGLVLAFLWMARSYLPPVLLGGLLAIVLHPLQRRLAPRLGSGVAAMVLTVGVLIVAVLPLAVLALRATTALTGFLDHEWPQTAARIRAYLASDSGPLASLGVDGSGLSDAADALVTSFAAGVARAATGMIVAVPGHVIALFLLCAAFFYLVSDAARVVGWLERASPFSPAETAELFASVRQSARGVLIGVFATALVQGGLTTLALLALGVPAAFALGVMAGLLSLVPLLGTMPVTIGAVIYLASIGRVEAAVVMTVAAVVIGVSDNLVRPYLMHVATPHQHPLLILLGVFGGVTAFGAVGVFLGPVLAALAAWAAITATRRSETLRNEPSR
jgi:predicted PurR-regulated permease PerM